MKQGYSISKWYDADEVKRRLTRVYNEPARELKENARDQYLSYFQDKCTRSKEIVDKTKQYIPGGIQHNLALNYPFPIAIKKAEGAFMWDVDDNQYIDFLQAGGPTVLGSNYKPVREKVIDLINECGPTTGLLSEYELKLAELVSRHMPSVELFRMLGSGTEGVMAAIRLAHCYTKHSKVIKFGGAYHGWSDQMVYDIRAAGTQDAFAPGIPQGCYANTQALEINDLDGLRELMKRNVNEGGTACVITEPLGPESGTRQVDKNFNGELRKLCDEFGALLIFDEVVTGFRVGMGGAQGYFGVTPDLTVFGKVLTGGYPMAGGVGGKKEIMGCMSAGIAGINDKIIVGGTLSANPLSCAAGYYTLLEIENTNACVKAGAAGDRLTAGLEQLVEKYALPFAVYSQGSIVHLDGVGNLDITFTKENREEMIRFAFERDKRHKEIGMALMAEGIVTIGASRMYMSLADTDDIIDEALNRFESVFKNYK